MGIAPRGRRAAPRRLIGLLTAGTVTVALTLQGGGPAAAAPPPSVAAVVADGAVTGPASVLTDPSGVEDRIVRFGTTVTPASGFAHPGIVIDLPHVEFVKEQVARGVEPWASAHRRATGSTYAKPTWTPHPSARLDRRTPGSNGHNGAYNLNQDGVAALTQALAYVYEPPTSSRRNAYAQGAIKILNAWSRTLTSVDVSAQLDAAWAAEALPRAAEIIRHTYVPPPGQPALDVPALSSMLTRLFVPQLDVNSPGAVHGGGNWALSMADGLISIGVFTDDRAIFDAGVRMWRGRVPAYIYQSGDNGGNGLPVPPPGTGHHTAATLGCLWQGISERTCSVPAGFAYRDGLSQETCRDISHTVLGFEAMMNGAETARLQGVDLFLEEQERIVDGYEFNAKYALQALDRLAPDGRSGTVGDGVCGGRVALGGGGYKLGWEIAYHHYAHRLGVAMPYTRQMLARVRPTQAGLHIAWETLTHAGGAPTGCTTPDERLGTSTVAIDVPADGDYRVWTRINPAADGAPAYLLQVDHGCPIAVGGGPVPPGAWTWIGHRDGDPARAVTLPLTAGRHTLTLVGRSPDLAVARILLTADHGCEPIGDGAGCAGGPAPAEPTGAVTATVSVPATVRGVVPLRAITSDPARTVDAEFTVDGAVVGSSGAPDFAVPWDSTAVADGPHSVRVSVRDRDGAVSTSPPLAFTVDNARPVPTPDTTAPTAPGRPTASTPTSTTVDLSWPPATDDVGVAEYRVVRDGTVVASGLVSPAYTDRGLAPTTTYGYVVQAVDRAGNVSSPSPLVQVRTADGSPPTQPGRLTALAASSTQVDLRWDAATDDVGVTGYQVLRNGTLVTTTAGRALSDGGLAAGKSYGYTVRAVDAAGNVGPAATVAASTLPAVAPAGAGLAAQYFANRTLSGPAVTRLDPTVNFSWGTGAPVAGIPADNFSARWTGTITPRVTGTYTLHTQTDDGTRLWIDDALVIDQWGGPSSTRSATYRFTAGRSYSIRLEYFEATAGAFARLLWSGPGIAKTAVPGSVLSSVGTGLTGTYHPTDDLSGTPAVVRPDRTVDFAWAAGAPDARLPADHFSVRWTGKLVAPSTGTTTFYAESDAGVRVWLDGKLVIDNWVPHGLVTDRGTVSLTAGRQYAVRVEYRETTGAATARLSWSYGWVPRTVIPRSALRDR
jgi:chitodextrinase